MPLAPPRLARRSPLLAACALAVPLVAASLFGASPALAQTTYYVSTSGNDSNSGTSTGAPWRTLGKVNGRTFQPGDRLLFRSGNSWTGQLRPRGSGAPGQPIVIGKYGGTAKPSIDGDGQVEAAVYINNQEHVEVTDLEVTNLRGTGNGKRKGVLVRAANQGTVDHIYLKRLYVHDVDGDVDKDEAGIAIIIEGTITRTRFRDLRIEDCLVEDVRGAGIITSSTWDNRGRRTGGSGAWYPSVDVVVRNNHVIRAGRNALIIRVADRPLIEYNVFQEGSRLDNGNAMFVFNTDFAKIQYNEAFLTQKSGPDGGGFDCDWNNKRCIIQYNYTHDNEQGSVVVIANRRGPNGQRGFNTGAEVKYNISQNDAGEMLRVVGPAEGTQFYNNTVYTTASDPELIVTDTFGNSGDEFSDDTVFRNNIFHLGGGGSYRFEGSTNIRFVDNVFFGIALPGQTSNVRRSGSITSNPLLVAPGSGRTGRNTVDGYKLQTGSPALNAGTAVSGNGGQDYFGNGVGSGATNLGAYNGPGVPAVTYEVEDLPVPKISDPVFEIRSDGASGGAYDVFSSDAAGDAISYTIDAPSSGSYQIQVRVRTGTSRGRFRASVRGVDQGDIQDLYSASGGYTDLSLGTKTLPAGASNITFRVTGRGSRSTGYKLAFDTISLVRVGASSAQARQASVESSEALVFELQGSHPNPVRDLATIAFTLPETADVSVEVFDVLGRQVLTAPAQQMALGSQSIPLDVSGLTSGLYVYRVAASTARGREVRAGQITVVQ